MKIFPFYFFSKIKYTLTSQLICCLRTWPGLFFHDILVYSVVSFLRKRDNEQNHQKVENFLEDMKWSNSNSTHQLGEKNIYYEISHSWLTNVPISTQYKHHCSEIQNRNWTTNILEWGKQQQFFLPYSHLSSTRSSSVPKFEE